MSDFIGPRLEALPCPFCGSKPLVLPGSAVCHGLVGCADKHCAASPTVSGALRYAGGFTPQDHANSAILIWNRRAV